MKEKSHVDDIDRSVYDIRDKEHDAYRIEAGLTPEIVDKISKEKNDPEWMHEFRLKSLEIYNGMKIPDWGPSIEGLDMEHIATYVRPNTKMQGDWKDVPQDIKDTFERLGIPQAERKSLAGVGAQYDSELVYHNVKDEVAAQGVIYTDMESALKGEYADMVLCSDEGKKASPCSKSRNGRFRVKRKTSKKKFAKKCREVNLLLVKMRTCRLKEIIAKLNQILTGYYHYYGITDNTESITAFRYNIMRSLFYCLNRRSQKKSYNWVEFLNRRMSGSGSMKYN